MRVAIALLSAVIVLPSGLPAGEPGETRVTVQKGSVVVEHDGVSTTLTTGREARSVAGASANVTGTEPPAPPPAVPIAVQWEPGQTVLLVDGEGILLRTGASGSEGKSADGRFAAKLTQEGELSVIDVKHERQAVRRSDGRWLHRFAGCEMRVDPSGRRTVRLPDGHEIVSPAPAAETPKPVASPVQPDAPVAPASYRWQIGIHLDKTGNGLRVAKVAPGSPAEAALFKPNDEVLAIGDLRSPTLEQIQERLKQARPAQKIPFTVRRGDKTVTLTVLMGAWE